MRDSHEEASQFEQGGERRAWLGVGGEDGVTWVKMCVCVCVHAHVCVRAGLLEPTCRLLGHQRTKENGKSWRE